MNAIIDCHVHLYSQHDEARLLSAALSNFERIAPLAAPAMLLVERSNNDRFAELQRGTLLPRGFVAAALGTGLCVLTEELTGRSIRIVAGFQIATSERLEVLSLCCVARTPDKLPLDETIAHVRASGGLPALAWAPGKWLGARGKLIQNVLDTERENGKSCDELLLCDTTLRPRGWPKPRLLSVYERRGGRVLAGSDPLPIASDESQAGSFAVEIESSDDLPATAESMRALLTDRTKRQRILGSRNNPIAWSRRYSRFMMSSK